MDASDAGLAVAEEAGLAVGEGAGAGVAAWQATSIVRTPRQPTIETDLLICPPITPVSDRNRHGRRARPVRKMPGEGGAVTVDAGSGSAKPQDGAGRVEGSDGTAQRVLSRLAGQIVVIRPCPGMSKTCRSGHHSHAGEHASRTRPHIGAGMRVRFDQRAQPHSAIPRRITVARHLADDCRAGSGHAVCHLCATLPCATPVVAPVVAPCRRVAPA